MRIEASSFKLSGFAAVDKFSWTLSVSLVYKRVNVDCLAADDLLPPPLRMTMSIMVLSSADDASSSVDLELA